MSSPTPPHPDAAAPRAAGDLREALRHVAVFEQLEDGALDALAAHGRPRRVAAGERFIGEGDAPDAFYALLEGELDVVKRGEDGADHRLLGLSAPAVVGEFALIDPAPRASSVVARTDGRLVAFDIAAVRADSALFQRILEHNARHATRLLRSNNASMVTALQARVAEEKRRVALGVLFVYVVTGLALYTISLPLLQVLQRLIPGDVQTSTLAILALATGLAIVAIKRTGFPFAYFGVTWRGWQRSLREGVLFSLPVLALLVGVKAVWRAVAPDMVSGPLFDPFTPFLRPDGSMDWAIYGVSALIYAATCPVQELIVRGCLQSALQSLIDGPRWRVVSVAVLTSNLLFATTHSHLNFAFAVTVFVPGLYWGWLRSRHETILGVTVSHALIGLFTLYVMGTGGLL